MRVDNRAGWQQAEHDDQALDSEFQSALDKKTEASTKAMPDASYLEFRTQGEQRDDQESFYWAWGTVVTDTLGASDTRLTKLTACLCVPTFFTMQQEQRRLQTVSARVTVMLGHGKICRQRLC